MTLENDTILSFDPGGTTGFAAVNSGRILYTAALDIDVLRGFCEFIYLLDSVAVVEQGPQFGHHSLITRNAEAIVIEYFPDAERVTPNRWKNTPIGPGAKSFFTDYRFNTPHEKDAAYIAYWYMRSKERERER